MRELKVVKFFGGDMENGEKMGESVGEGEDLGRDFEVMDEEGVDLGMERQGQRWKREERLERERRMREEKEGSRYRQERRAQERAEGLHELDWEMKERMQGVGQAAVEAYRRGETGDTHLEEVYRKFERLIERAKIGEGGRSKNTEEKLERYKDAKVGTEEGLYKISCLSTEEQIRFLCGSDDEHLEQKMDFLDKALARIDRLTSVGGEVYRRHYDVGEKAACMVREAVMEASMVGTPEYAAYVAGKHEQQARYGKVSPTYPVVIGADSGIWQGEIGDWRDICREYKRIEEQVRRKNPEADESVIQQKAIVRAKNIYADSYEYHAKGRVHTSSCQTSFRTAVAVAQIGSSEAKKRVLGMIRGEHSVEGVWRFLGRTGGDRKVQSLQRELGFLQNLDEEVGVSNAREVKKQEQYRTRETERIKHKYDKLGEKLESERRKEENERERTEALVRLNGECDERVEYFQNRTEEQREADRQARIEELRGKIEKRRSVLDKALDLKFAYLELAKEEPNDYWYFVHQGDRWIKKAQFGEIKRAHRALRQGKSLREIESDSTHSEFDERLLDGVEDEEVSKRLKEGDLCGKRRLIEDYFERGEDYEGLGRQKFVEFLVRGPELEWMSAAEAKDFPFMGGDKARELWCAKHSAADVSEFPEGRIGKIIYTRLRTGVDENLHGASFWLSSFGIGEEDEHFYDTAKIKRDVAAGVEGVGERLSEYEIKVQDIREEDRFLLSLIALAPEERKKMKLSGKETVVEELFTQPGVAWAYGELVDLYKGDMSSMEVRAELLKRFKEFKESWQEGGEGRSDDDKKLAQGLTETTIETTEEWLESLCEKEGIDVEGGVLVTPREISEKMRELRGIGQRRKEYINDATTWLTRHMTTPSQDLRKAWQGKYRALALANGVADNAKSINAFIGRQGVLSEVEYMERRGLSKEELEGEYRELVDETLRCEEYTPRAVIDIVAQYKGAHNGEKVMPADMRVVKIGEEKYKAEILAHDDPRGYTIGPDTGCCMHYGGASESCIRQGYNDKQAGFFAMYGPDDRISAQSFFYINPERPDVIVMDNIEARGQGRNAERIVEVYRDYFQSYLTEQFEDDPDWQVREVHIGTQYGELVKPIVSRLPGAEIVRNHNRGTYTDAAGNQVLLLKLREEEIADAKLRGAIKRGEIQVNEEEARELAGESEEARRVRNGELRVNHTPEEFASRLGMEQAEIVRELEARLYPEEMRQYEDEDFLESELRMPEAERYSFIINSERDAVRRPAGYCLAYEADAEGAEGRCVYVADFGIVPEERGGWAALKGFRELVKRVKDNGGGAIEMGARESTSYRLFKSEAAQKVLRRLGYEVRDLGVEDEFSENEKTYLLRLEPIE